MDYTDAQLKRIRSEASAYRLKRYADSSYSSIRVKRKEDSVAIYINGSLIPLPVLGLLGFGCLALSDVECGDFRRNFINALDDTFSRVALNLSAYFEPFNETVLFELDLRKRTMSAHLVTSRNPKTLNSLWNGRFLSALPLNEFRLYVHAVRTEKFFDECVTSHCYLFENRKLKSEECIKSGLSKDVGDYHSGLMAHPFTETSMDSLRRACLEVVQVKKYSVSIPYKNQEFNPFNPTERDLWKARRRNKR